MMYFKKFIPYFAFCKRRYRRNCYSFQKSLYLKLIYLFLIQSYVLSDDVDNVTIIESDITYNPYDALYNESYENLTASNQNISDENINNTSMSNFDLSTEFESTIVTEDFDTSFQSNRKQPLFLIPDEEICNCDLTSNVCDINCCCDPDCSDEDKKVFSECSHQVLTADENYCYQKDIIYRNNTVYKMVKSPNGMFCIMHDNFKHHLRYKDMPVLRSHRDLSSVLKFKFKTTYSWDFESKASLDSSELKYGNPMYVVLSSNKKGSSYWNLPSPCLSDICSCFEQIPYLIDFKSSCSYVINLEKDCESNKIISGDAFLNFCISSHSPSVHSSDNIANLITHTKLMDTNSSVNDDEYYFSQTNKICIKENPIKPKKKSGVCANVVQSIHFTVEQDGVNGITKIDADFKYTNINLKQNMISQTYSVNFIWSNISDVEKKSGNPGYQIGLPILAATNGSSVDSEEMFITLNKTNLSIPGRDVSSFCSNERQAIKFGKNLKSGCRLEINVLTCKDLQNKVSNILLGSSKKEIYVGIFGNANISNLDDWIEVFHDVPESLDNDKYCLLSLGLKINIIYAAVGTVANPQYKIVGVEYHYLKPEVIDVPCSSCDDIVLTSSVSFFDVTLPAVQHYSKVPSIKANLPSDFFYPFLYGKSVKNLGNIYLVVILYILKWKFY